MKSPRPGALALVFALAGPAHAETPSVQRVVEEVAYTAGSAVGTLVYAPIKGAFCALGAVAGAVVLVAAGPDEAARVTGSTCRGTWLITPEIMRGAAPIDLVGDGAAQQ